VLALLLANKPRNVPRDDQEGAERHLLMAAQSLVVAWPTSPRRIESRRKAGTHLAIRSLASGTRAAGGNEPRAVVATEGRRDRGRSLGRFQNGGEIPLRHWRRSGVRGFFIIIIIIG
jgi:hypothetical protein